MSMTPAPDTSRAEAAPAGSGTGADIPIQGRCDRAIRHRVRAALERELAVARAAGDEAARERLVASLQSTIRT